MHFGGTILKQLFVSRRHAKCFAGRKVATKLWPEIFVHPIIPMNKQHLAYWIATGLFCLAMTAGGTMNLMHFEVQRESIAALGYPEYLMTILGTAKLLGVIALLIPGVPLLKEWAYAGFTFDLLGASASHAFVSDPPMEIILPLILLGIAAASYFLRPSSRRLKIIKTPENEV